MQQGTVFNIKDMPEFKTLSPQEQINAVLGDAALTAMANVAEETGAKTMHAALASLANAIFFLTPMGERPDDPTDADNLAAIILVRNGPAAVRRFLKSLHDAVGHTYEQQTGQLDC